MTSEPLHPSGSASVPADDRYRALFEAAASGMLVASLEGRFVLVNPALCRMLGYTQGELLTLDFVDVTHPGDRQISRQLLQQLLDGRIPSFVAEKRYRRKDGTVVWGRISGSLIRDAAGAPSYVTATIEDITSHRSATEALDLNQSLLRVAGRMAKVGGWALALPSQEVFWSDEMFDILELPRGEVPPLAEGNALYAPEDRERLEAAIEACAGDGMPFDLELAAVTFSGRKLWVRVVGEAELAADGTITRLTGAYQDISELRDAYAQVEEVADRLTTSLESMTDAVYLLDQQWRFSYVNRRAEQLLLRERDELLGRNIWEVFPEAVDHPVHQAFHRAVGEGTAVHLEDMHYPPLDSWFSQSLYPSAQGLAVYFRDVTEPHEAQVALEQRETQLAEQAALLDETQEAIFVQDLDGVVTYWNRGAERIYGLSYDEAVGGRACDLVAGDRDLHAAARRAVVTDGVWSDELTHLTPDGGDLIVDARWTLLRDPAGAPRSILVTDTDVTANRRMEQHLIRSQRIESIGTLAGGIAHDLNNVLAPILLAIELLSAGETDPGKLEILRTIEGSAQRGAAMVRQVLSFARGVEGNSVELEVSDLISDVLRIATDTFPRDIHFTTGFPRTVGRVRGDETQLHQVLMNLLVNARDAMPDGGTVSVSATTTAVDGAGTAGTPSLALDRQVVLQVTDDGSGMPPEVSDRIFEPFFTTKRHGEGTGLGLSTSLAIIESHGGHIEVESAPGRGSTFSVYLPLSTSLGDLAAAEPSGGLHRGRGELVLVVDDEAAVRTLMQHLLQAAGYRVLAAGDGAEAVALYRLRHDDIALVITDLMMPVMGGSAAIDALRRIDPAVRVVAVSGLSEQPDRTGAPVEVGHVLQKPFDAEQLLRVAATALAEGSR